MKKRRFQLSLFIYSTLLMSVLSFVFGCGSNQYNPKTYQRPENAKIELRSDIVFLSATELARKIKTGELTSLEVVDAYLSQIYEYNPQINAVVTVNAEEARKRAREADEALRRGKIWGPLHGVPVTIKDHIATKSIRTTSGTPYLENFVPDYDATVVSRLKKAGAIILGKTNIPKLGVDPQTNNPVFGRTNNPWDLERTPGGSSGGSSAAVAAGLTPLDIGADGGGSIRTPAHFTGVFGLKPTEHMVSLYGVLPYPGTEPEYNQWRHMMCPGPLARSVDDLKLALSLIAGQDINDPAVPGISINFPAPKPIHDLRIAWTDQFAGKISNETKKAMEKMIEKLKAKGITVEKINPPEFDFGSAFQTTNHLQDMEWMAGFPFYLRFFINMAGGSFGADSVYYSLDHEEYLKVLTSRDHLITEMEKFLSNYDAWITPASVTTAYKHIQPKKWKGPIAIYENNDIMVDGKPVQYWRANGSYAVIFSMTGNPVVSMPIGVSNDSLPVNVQVVGSRWQDAQLLTVTKQLFEAGGELRNPPGYK